MNIAASPTSRLPCGVLDDDCLFENNSGGIAWPGGVIRLVASPRSLPG